jgi:glycosyltransferase involved in cell wall biosynthesis
MRIAHVTSRFVPAFYGGAEVLCDNLARLQLARGDDVVVITNLPHYRFDDSHVVNLDAPSNQFTTPLLIAQPHVDRALRQALAEFAPDVVHVHNVHGPLGFGAYREAAAWPSVATFHDYHLFCLRTDNMRIEGSACNDRRWCAGCARTLYVEKTKEVFPQRRAQIDAIATVAAPLFGLIPPVRNARRERALAKWIDEFICPSEDLRRTMVLWGLPPERIEVIGSIVGVPAAPQASPARRETVRFGYIGKLVRLKGVHLAIEAVRALAAGGTKVRLTIAGDGADAPALRDLAEGLDCVEFLGRIDGPQIERFYAGIDALLVPSIWPEPSPLVVLEAMGRQKPVVVSNIGGMPDQVGPSGLVAKANDAADLARAMQTLVDDPSLREELGRRARARVLEHFTPERILERTHDVYLRAIESKKATHAARR